MKKVATTWLDGCSGCHMSFLDLDEALLELAQHIQIVASPYVDYTAPDFYPDNIDIALIEGAVSTTEDLHKAKLLRQKSKYIVAFGDCAITSNVSGLRTLCEPSKLMDQIYRIQCDGPLKEPPTQDVPALLPKVLPLREVIKVDYSLPGCPVPPQAIYAFLKALLEGTEPPIQSHFGQ